MPKAPRILLLGTYQDNYLTLGTRTFHVPPEDIALAMAQANATFPTAPPDGPPPDVLSDDEAPRKRGRSK